jgi:hypothetical protein
MTDGRVYTLEDEIDVIHEDLGRARRHIDDLERARHDGRMANESELDQAIGRARDRVRDLELALREACAQQIAAAEGFAC